jgi:hypothetical protein
MRFNWDVSITASSGNASDLNLLATGIAKLAPANECLHSPCVEFPSSGGFFRLPTINFGQLPGLTISVWIKPSSTSGSSARIVDISSASSGAQIVVSRLGTSSKMRFSVQRPELGSVAVETLDGTFEPNVWKHITWTLVPKTALRVTAEWRIYVDGTLVKVFNGLYAVNQTLTNAFVGRSNISDHGAFVGYMDSLMIFSVALTANEVRVVMAVSDPDFAKAKTPALLVSTTDTIFVRAKVRNWKMPRKSTIVCLFFSRATFQRKALIQAPCLPSI